jgi:hypothetical protein
MKKIILLFLVFFLKINGNQEIYGIVKSIDNYKTKKTNTIPQGLKDALQKHIDRLNTKLKKEILNEAEKIQTIVNSIEKKIQEHNDILKLRKSKKRKKLLITNIQEIIDLKNQLYANLKILKNENIKEKFPNKVLENSKNAANQIAIIFKVPQKNQTKSN